MAAPTSPAPRPPAPGHRSHAGIVPAEWPTQAADTIVDVIGKVRDKTTKPAIVAARGLVYGPAAAIMGTAAFILLLVMIVRLWAVYVPGHVWVIYAIFAVVFGGGGMFCLHKAKETKPDEAPQA